MTAKKVDLGNEINDDWIRKANPKAREQELKAHDELSNAEKPKAGGKRHPRT